MILKTLISMLRCVWLGLELNSCRSGPYLRILTLWEDSMLWNLGLAIHVDVTYLSIVLWKWYSLVAVASFGRIMHPATNKKWFSNGLRRTTMSLRCWLGLQTSIQSSICGVCWTNKTNTWSPHLTTYRTLKGSSGVHASMDLGCFGSKSGTTQ